MPLGLLAKGGAPAPVVNICFDGKARSHCTGRPQLTSDLGHRQDSKILIFCKKTLAYLLMTDINVSDYASSIALQLSKTIIH